MSAIYGIFLRDFTADSDLSLQIETLRLGHTQWGPDGGDVWFDPHIGIALGQARFFSTPEAIFEHLPFSDPARGIIFTVAGRLDNRAELMAECRLLMDDWVRQNQHSILPDGDLIYLAYLRWGEDAPRHIYGDWAFAAYHPIERRLFVARDHFGNTALYYYVDAHTFAFASDRQALLALGLPRGEMDELYLAQVMISWPAYHGERTIFTNLKRLPPAHTITVTPEHLETRQYWHLEETPLLRLPNRQDYVEAFRDVFDQAVRARLRVSDSSGSIASSLSGGLDSGAVTATAAGLLRATGKMMDAYTSIPLTDPAIYVGQRFANEWPYAHATAEFAGNIHHFSVEAAGIGILESIRIALEIYGEPTHAAGNLYWLIAMQRAARAAGSRVFLTGQMGNAGISWTGSPFSQSVLFQIRQMGMAKWAKERLKRFAFPFLPRTWQKQRVGFDQWCRASAIHPAFARRLDLLERRLIDPDEQLLRSPLEQRLFLQPGRSFGGALHAQSGAAQGLEIRDPTGDARLLAFTFSVPDWVFIDPQTGLDRWLIRAAMQGRLPDSVRLNRLRGRQAGDLVPRLRADADQVEAALDALGRGPAAAYVDVPYMRQAWQMIQAEDTPAAFLKAVTVLTRGIMAGLFVNAC